MKSTYIKNPTSVGEMIEYLKTNYELRGGYDNEEAKKYLAEKAANDLAGYLKEYREIKSSLEKTTEDYSRVEKNQKNALKNYYKKKASYTFSTGNRITPAKKEFDWACDMLKSANADLDINKNLRAGYEEDLKTLDTKMNQIADIYSQIEPKINWKSFTERE